MNNHFQRSHNSVNMPSLLPMMIVSDMTLFPHTLLPILVNGSVYRNMLQEVLEGDRFIGLTSKIQPTSESFHPIIGVGILRVCIFKNTDESHLIIQGISRMKILEWQKSQLFCRAYVEKVESILGESEAIRGFLAQLHELFFCIKEKGITLPDQFEEYISQINDPSILTDLIASAFIKNFALRQELLEELSIQKRLEKLFHALKDV